ncbi:MAG: CRISPR-associated endonuclease Cas1 [Pirellulales bacterium]|nr:CRISPR-associated endonuclease Cas1 [Pirellulales bacterium]
MVSSLCESRVATDVPDLIPARMLNEFAYCPRLAYLEWVQGEFADNLETIEGRFGHRSVDRESRGDVPEPGDDGSPTTSDDGNNSRESASGRPKLSASSDEDEAGADPSEDIIEPIHTRSLMLSSTAEGLIAKMDLVDINAYQAVPVDYKRGRVPDIDGGAWEPERVQLCAQGLILRDNGYDCEGGILYYVESRRRVSVPFNDTLVDRTRELVQELRAVASAVVLPPPLDNSPKCPRCSLVGICLPDETCLLTAQDAPEKKVEIRRLMPARDDRLPLYIQEQGTTLGKSGDELTVKQKQQVLQKAKLLDLSQVNVFGNVQITAQALREITARGIPVCHFSYGGWFHAATVGMTHKNVELRIGQFANAADPQKALGFARSFVVGKIKNSRTLLRRHFNEDPDRMLPKLARLAKDAEQAPCLGTLLGIEGTAAKIYFSGLAGLLKGDVTFRLDGRNRRPPRDPVNALLSFVYAMLVKELTIALYAIGFDPMLGFYHQPRYGRPSLALDLAEPFRPLVGDSAVLTMINNGEVTSKSFIRKAGAVALTTAGRRAVIAAFERRMDTLFTHSTFGYRVSYRRIIEVQARLLARTVLGELDTYPNFCTR